MNNEQNIDDILKMLKESVNNSSSEADIPETDKKTAAKMSNATLQKKLKEQFSPDGTYSVDEEESPYALDRELLEGFSSVEVEEDVIEEDPVDEDASEEAFVEEAEDTPVEEDIVEDIIEENIIEEDIVEEDIVEEVESFINEISASEVSPVSEEKIEAGYSVATIEEDIAVEDGDDEELVWEDDIDVPEEYFDYEDVAVEEIENASDELYEQLNMDIDDSPAIEGDTAEELEDVKEESEEFDTYPEIKRISMRTLIMDYGRPDPAPPAVDDNVVEVEEDTPDIDEIISDFAEAPLYEDARMSESVRKIMLGLGCEEDLDDLPAEAITEVFSEYDDSGEDDGEYVSPSQKEGFTEGYKKATAIALIKLLGCAVLAVLIFLYDTLPIFDYVFLINPSVYPAAYVLIGTQLLLLCALCLWRSLEDGARRLATLDPNVNSMAIVILFFNVLYDVILFAMNTAQMPMFHFLSATVFVGISLGEFLMLRRECRCFEIYSSDVTKYTLTYDLGKNSIAEKMYSGGFDKTKTVYSPSPVSFPRGLFSAIREKPSFNNKALIVFLLSSPLMSILTAIVMMLLEQTVEDALVASMSMLYLTLPIGAVISVCPLYLSARRLTKRGIALTGEEMIKKYADAKVMVFNDLHLFKKCETRDVGFVCYEKGQTNAVLSAMQIFYSRIGGPMSDVFDGIPEMFKAQRIRVRRITRNGVESVIDKKHVLLVGDIEFMRRYGIEFSGVSPESETSARATVYVSYDGRASAKISARYVIEPIFDMLIERLSAEGGHCVIETYDPIINTELVARLRGSDRSPISIVHKNAVDINRSSTQRPKKVSENGILAISSRLKLIEAVVWCNRILKAKRRSGVVNYISAGVGAVAVVLLCVLGAVSFVDQYLILLYTAIADIVILLLTLRCFPKKRYFTVAALENEEREISNEQKKKEKIDE